MRRGVAAVALVGLLATGCGNDDGATPRSLELVVSAAASLTAPFTEIGIAFEEGNPGASVTFAFGPSDGLATQIVEGAPVDVFASASPAWMDLVQDEGPGTTGRVDFVRNRLAILTPADDPARIQGLEDLARPAVKLVLAAEGVPAGDYARESLSRAGIAEAALANVVSNEEDVKGVVTKVLSGDADAGIAYVTDVTPEIADRVRLVPIPDALNVIATYPIAVLESSKEADLAQRFIDFVLGRGQRILAAYGFLSVA